MDRYPGATAFYLKAGIHRRQTIRPKDDNRFIGELGAVLDGEGVTQYAFETLNHHPQRVTLQRLVIQRYVPPIQRGAIQGDNAHAWIIEDSEIHDNAYAGLRTGPGMIVRRNHIYRNGLNGIVGYRADGVLVEDNEVFANNPSGSAENGDDAGMKFVGCHNLTVRRNHVYGNLGKGIWSDTNFPTVIIEDNRVTDNRDAGIWHEVSYDAIIRYNTVERNGGTTAPNWLQAGGINVTNSPNVQVYGNTVSDNANGIGVMQTTGYPTGPYGPNEVTNLLVRDNVIKMQIGRTGLAQNLRDTSYYTSRNNRFENNTYYLGTDQHLFPVDRTKSDGGAVAGIRSRCDRHLHPMITSDFSCGPPCDTVELLAENASITSSASVLGTPQSNGFTSLFTPEPGLILSERVLKCYADTRA